MADIPLHRTCGAHDMHLALLRTNADYARARLSIDAMSAVLGDSALKALTGPRVIPVVVHVIHRGGLENIADTQIKSQIDVLNQDFRMENADIGSVPKAFKTLAADALVEFALATRDPEGKATSGITRTKTKVKKFHSDNAMKFKTSGGHDAWDSTRYLNIWVCPELIDGPRQLLGYAQFPGGLPATDGVVIIHNAFGTNGTAAAPFDRGRTTTHEVGHWLDLFHIWGDSPDCVSDDLVADTPIQQTQNFGKPMFPHVSCSNGPDGDMFMNYMDYVDDAAMFMFTIGQVARIQATLAGPRSTIGLPVVSALAGVSASA
ncbi:zinc metalloprotease [Mesorhizobium sp. LNJC405B00]|uniref:zinc metalloprotease n=1 Tax=Mesorhizobium sp. LNJC405B00 TaxID=1287281 RepID=UPI0004CF1A14|nr:zinc metalloprotease [Mesorhizobium sp. LNJC405B00]